MAAWQTWIGPAVAGSGGVGEARTSGVALCIPDINCPPSETNPPAAVTGSATVDKAMGPSADRDERRRGASHAGSREQQRQTGDCASACERARAYVCVCMCLRVSALRVCLDACSVHTKQLGGFVETTVKMAVGSLHAKRASESSGTPQEKDGRGGA